MKEYRKFIKITGYRNKFFRKKFMECKSKLLHDLIIKTKEYPEINKYLEAYFKDYNEDVNIIIHKEHKWTPLHLSSSLCNYLSSIETLKVILNARPDLNPRDDEGSTPLLLCSSLASNSSSVEAVEMLCDAGANVNLKSKNGRSPLHEATLSSNADSNVDTVKILIKYGADVNSKDIIGFTPLHLSCRSVTNGSNYETIKLLLDAGADINLDSNDKCTALHYSIAAYISNLKKNKSCNYNDQNNKSDEILQVINLLISSGANLNHQDLDGYTPIYYAAVFGSFIHNDIILKILIKAGADINIPNNLGETPLIKCQESFKEHMYSNIINILIDKSKI